MEELLIYILHSYFPQRLFNLFIKENYINQLEVIKEKIFKNDEELLYYRIKLYKKEMYLKLVKEIKKKLKELSKIRPKIIINSLN